MIHSFELMFGPFGGLVSPRIDALPMPVPNKCKTPNPNQKKHLDTSYRCNPNATRSMDQFISKYVTDKEELKKLGVQRRCIPGWEDYTSDMEDDEVEITDSEMDDEIDVDAETDEEEAEELDRAFAEDEKCIVNIEEEKEEDSEISEDDDSCKKKKKNKSTKRKRDPSVEKSNKKK